MSLIEEALRRAQDPVMRQIPDHPKPEWKPSEAVESAHPRSLTVIALTLTGGLVSLMGVWTLWMMRSASPPAKTAPPVIDTLPVLTGPPAMEEAPMVAVPQRPPEVSSSLAAESVTLSGIVEGLGEPYAVINGAIVGIGEQAGEATLEAIAKGAVTLRYADGRRTTIRLSRQSGR